MDRRTHRRERTGRADRDRSERPERSRTERPERSRAERRDERREQLLDAAVTVVRRMGPAASMDQLAAEAGVTKPILYRHFGDRRGLSHAVADRFAGALLTELAAGLATTGDGRQIVHSTIDAFLAFVEREPQLYRFLVESPEGTHVVADFIPRIVAAVASTLGENLRAAGVDSGPAEVWAHGIVGMVHAAGNAWVQRPTMPRHRLVEHLTDLLWSGLASAGLSPPDVEGSDR